MPKQFLTSCSKGHSLDITIIGKELKFTRDFDGDWNSCSDHTCIKQDMRFGKNCMMCGHLFTEAF